MNYMADGKQRCESCKTANKRLAEKLLAIRKAEIFEGKYRLPKSNPPTLQEWADQFLETIHRPNTKRPYQSCVKILNAHFGRVRLSQVTVQGIEAFKATRTRAGAGPAIINRNLAVLRRMLKLAVRQHLIARSPFEDVEFLDERTQRRQPIVLGFDEQERLEKVSPPLLRTLITLLCDSGLRIGCEALPLMWQDVDLLNDVIYVRHSKTPAGRRAMPMTKRCKTAMQEWMRITGPVFSPYVFANPATPEAPLKSVRKTWARALKAAKLSPGPIYDLRSTFASRLSATGAPDNMVAGMLGHSSPSIVSTYAKVIDEFRRDAIQRLERLRESKAPGTASGNQPANENVDARRWVN
jgi:integrase